MTIRLRPDFQWFRSPKGTTLIAGSPLSFFKVSENGAKILALIENNELMPEGHESLTSRLVAAGAAHPLWHMPIPASDITIVIPTYFRESRDLDRLLGLVRSLSEMKILVIDDCSPEPFIIDGVTVIRHDTNQGPGAARNTGLQHVTTPFVAFIDDDVHISADCVRQLAAQMNDERVALVAPRVVTSQNNRLTGEYDAYHSPLDLGNNPTLIRPLSRVSYVPAAAIVCRTSVVRSVNGFNAEMRKGEDVDFLWRVADAGHLCRYEPTLTCTHEARTTVRDLVKQRFGYGTSAASLSASHGNYVSPFRANIVLLIPSMILVFGYIWIFLPLLPFVYLWYHITLRRSALSFRQRARLTTQGLAATIRLFASAIARAWWPLFAIMSIFVFGAGFAFFASLLVPAIYGVLRHRPQRIFGYIGLRILDNLAYGAGVWWGAISARSLRCLIPTITRSPLRLRSKG
jgi:mycofactocin system glycosyltransferase